MTRVTRLDRFTETQIHMHAEGSARRHTNAYIHTHARTHFSKAVEWNNGQVNGIVGRFYHSHSLNHQPSAKCMHSYRCVCGCVCECVQTHTCAHERPDQTLYSTVPSSSNTTVAVTNQWVK